MWNTACPPRWQREGIPVTSLGRVYSYWTGKLRLNKCCKFGNPRNMVWLFCRYLYMFGYIITSFFRVLPLKNRHFHTGYFAQTLIFLMRRSPIQRARGIQCLKRNSHTNYSDYPWMFKSQAHQLFISRRLVQTNTSSKSKAPHLWSFMIGIHLPHSARNVGLVSMSWCHKYQLRFDKAW